MNSPSPNRPPEAPTSQWAEPVDLARRAEPPELLRAVTPGPGRLLLEAGPGGAAGWGAAAAIAGGGTARWSVATAAPVQILTWPAAAPAADPLAAVDAVLTRFAVAPRPDLPPFCGGLAGYLGYELGGCVERLPPPPPGGPAMPDLYLGLYEAALALDHATGQVWACGTQLPGRGDAARTRAMAWARRLQALVDGGSGADRGNGPAASGGPAPGALSSSLDRAAFMAAVERARAYIAAGDIFQVNLAQRYSLALPNAAAAGLDTYLRLRQGAPAPFAAYLEGPGFAVASASPERFLLVDSSRRVETRPIKGTRPRGAAPAEDARLAQALLDSAKDTAELVMIVDLERNDLGRVCAYGSVGVAELRRLESYPTVHHTAATVRGELRPGVTAAGLLRAAFPGGSITGAPKVRAMEIVAELEPVPRGVYTGAIGYLGLDGRMDLNIAIRTVILSGSQALFHAGCGIVADSDPAGEYAESVAKARALAGAVGVTL